MDRSCRIELLGGLRVIQADRVIDRFRTRKTAALLAYLAFYPHRQHPREALIELLWPESIPELGRRSLRTALSSLRQQCEPEGVAAGAVIVADRAWVRLNPEGVVTDVAEFLAALKTAAGAGSNEEQTLWLARVVELYQGELLPGHFDEWILQEREWLAERFFQALRQLLARLERASEFERALEFARRGVSADPLREEVRADLMRLLAAVGQHTAALRQYQELERLLETELGAVPSPATQALAREIERLAVLRPSGVQVLRRRVPAQRVDIPVSAHPEHLNTRTLEHLAPEGENRLATLLFTAVCHSLPPSLDLHPADGAALVSRLFQAMVDVVLKYGGRIDRFLADGLLAVFGAPQAHEDDPERAIRAALEIRTAARQLGLEVAAGIQTGEVYVGGPGAEPSQEVAVLGPAASVAAGLQEQAQAGQILVGAATWRLTRRAFEYASPQILEGHVQQDPVYVVQRALPRPAKPYGIEGLRAELVGREEELAKLKAALSAVLQGRGQIVSLIGEAGVGKSRLVAELKQGVRGGSAAGYRRSRVPAYHSPLLWLEGRCLELNMTTGYSLFIDLFRDYFAWQPEEDDRRRGERLVAVLAELAARGDLPEERRAEIGPLLGNLLSARFDADWDERLKIASPEQIRYQTLLAVRDFFIALAQAQPILLVLEDLHWADSLSLDLISLLLESLASGPLLLLCVYRPEREHRSWGLGSIAARKCAERYVELQVRELTPAQSRQLIDSLLTTDSRSASVKELILEKARGNPFFVEEVIRSLIDAGLVSREGAGTHGTAVGAWQAKEGIKCLPVPESVQSVILSRLDRLTPDLKHVLQSASVMGRVFRRRPLDRMSGAADLDGVLWELEERGLIYQERVVPEEEYSFQHVLTQETIYASIRRRRRALLHQQVAEAMEALYPGRLDEHSELLAYHYERSDVDEKAIEYLLKAAEKARRAYLNDDAVGYFQRALQRLEASGLGTAQQARRLEVLKGLGKICHEIGNMPEAEKHLRQSVLLGRELGLAPHELAQLYYWLGEVLWWQNRYDAMQRVGEEGLALLGEQTDSVGAALMNQVVAVSHQHHANWEEWQNFVRRNVVFLQRLPYSEELRALYTEIAQLYAFTERNIDEALNWLEALERKAEQHHDLRALGFAHLQTGLYLLRRGDLVGALVRLQQAWQLFHRIGYEKDATFALEGIAEAYLHQGDLCNAEEYNRQTLETGKAVGHQWVMALAHLRLAIISLCQGAWEKAVNASQKALQLDKDVRQVGPGPLLALGRANLAWGKRDEALRQFQEAISQARSDPQALISAVSGLEEGSEDPTEFRACCRRFQDEHPGPDAASCARWFLEAAEPGVFAELRIRETFVAPLSAAWVWQDPFGDCSFTVGNGLQICAANGRDLWYLNLSGPRLLQPASGDVAAQTACVSVSAETPAIGGLLLWRDKGNFLRLERGTRGAHEISFQGGLGNQEVILGRGRLSSERVFLRLERLGSRVNALCSADGKEWFTVGQAVFPAEDPVQVGLHAIGAIDRTIYQGSYPEGTAIRFEEFQLWTSDE